MAFCPDKSGGYQWRALRYKCLRLIHTIQASVKRRLKNYMMFLSVYRSFFVEADNCRLVLRNYLYKHTNMDDEAPYSNGMACRDMPFEWNNDTFRKS